MYIITLEERIEDIEAAILEAQRFIEKATKAKETLLFNDSLEYAMDSTSYSKTFAAAKRASLDLTNALAQMRKRPSERKK